MSDGPTHEMTLTDALDDGAREAILWPLAACNEAQGGPARTRAPAVLLREAGNAKIVGGLWGRTARGWLYVEPFFVPESLRGRGVRTEVVRFAEAEAARRGCVGVRLDTCSFQAWGFHARLGYAVTGRIEDCPPGHVRYSLAKRLDRAG